MDYQNIFDKLDLYDPNYDKALVQKAIDFAINYHGHQIRDSGEAYYHHPIAVANIICDMHLDSSSVITAILHDTIEDTNLTLAEIEKHFGVEIARLVDGVTKLNKIELQSVNLRQAENFRKLLLAMSEDIRVLLVKLADRLHNIRTISCIKSKERQKKIAHETMEIYAPLAERIGIHKIKLELQDTCFQILHPDARETIINKLEALNGNDESIIEKIVEALKNTITKNGMIAKIYGRRKTPFSIWIKMQQQNTTLDQLSDIIAFRIEVKNVQECYQALGIIHMEYKMVPEKFQDFISLPKSNGYQSLHTIVIGPLKHRIEIQIRTRQMHEIAELGVAAHWRYKQNYYSIADGLQYNWIRELLGILEQSADPEEFLQNTKMAMYYDQVFCFTPKGNLIALPKDATPVDFAYQVHSSVGNHCIGAKINGKIAPLKTQLKNGDQVNIITAKNHFPSPAWEKFVVTGKARSEIRKFIRSKQDEEYIKLGQILLDKALRVNDIKNNEQNLKNACEIFHKKSNDELYYAIGNGEISRDDVIKVLQPKKNAFSSTISFLSFNNSKKFNNKESKAIPIKGLISGMAIHMAGCCHPLPSDKILGIIHTGQGLTVHSIDCDDISDGEYNNNKIIDLTWEDEMSSTNNFICRLKVVLSKAPDSVIHLTSEITRNKASVINFKIINRTTEFIEAIVDVEFSGMEQMNNIIAILSSKSLIFHVERIKQ